DNDDPPEVELADNESADEDDGYIEFTVELSAESGKFVSVEYYLSDHTAKSGDYSYDSPSSGIVEFAPGETSKKIRVAIYDDSIDEYDEQFYVTIHYPYDAVLGDTTQVTGTIYDDDLPPTVSISDAS